ncbi:MAG: hypothetical protein WAW37_13845 [Syntrophobacteraceae bacterium]
MKAFTSTVTLIVLLVFPLVAFGAVLPQLQSDVLITGRVEAVEWPHIKVATDDGRIVQILMRDNNVKTFLPGDEVELQATCLGDGTDCEFRAWDSESEPEARQVRRAPALPETPRKEWAPREFCIAPYEEIFEARNVLPPFRYDYASIYRASNDLKYTRVPTSEPTGGYFLWSGIITAVQSSPEDKVYVVMFNPESGFAFSRIKKAEGRLEENGPVTVVGKYLSNWVVTRSDGRKVTVPLLSYGHARAKELPKD